MPDYRTNNMRPRGSDQNDPRARLAGRLRNGRDQSPMPMSRPGSFTAGIDQGETLDLATAARCVEWLLTELTGEDQPAFLAFLRDLGNDVAADRRPRSGRRMAGDRRLAQDVARAAQATHDFLRRFPEARHIRTHSFWRD